MRKRIVHRPPTGKIRSSLAWTADLARGHEFHEKCIAVAKKLGVPLALVKKISRKGGK